MDGMPTASRVIPANTYRRERWKNGAGWTREILRWPREGDWTWRLSIAEIEEDAPFSSFPGVERELVLLSGNGLRLRFDDGRVTELHPPHERARFAGESRVQGELIDGPTQDFNLMWRRDAIEAELWHRPLVGPMVIFAEPGTAWLVHLLAGQAHFTADSGLPPLAAADTALLATATGRLRHVLDGGGEVLLVRLRAR
jgi:environmental stress-induced protein Ves